MEKTKFESSFIKVELTKFQGGFLCETRFCLKEPIIIPYRDFNVDKMLNDLRIFLTRELDSLKEIK